MAGKAERMARIARIRSLQKRQALAHEAQVLGERDQIRSMADRLQSLRMVYTPDADEADSFALKSKVHQYERLGKALAATRDRESRANVVLDDARAETLDAYRRARAAEELAARSDAAETSAAELRQERNAAPRRTSR